MSEDDLLARLRREEEGYAALQSRCYEGFPSASDGIFDALREAKRENAELRGLLLECKRAFLGYPQEARRSPLDLLRDMNRVLATEGTK